jgi:hypothetical protein
MVLTHPHVSTGLSRPQSECYQLIVENTYEHHKWFLEWSETSSESETLALFYHQTIKNAKSNVIVRLRYKHQSK